MQVKTSFTIHAAGAGGVRLTQGGAVFKVAVRGQATVNPTIVDNKDGTYLVELTYPQASRTTRATQRHRDVSVESHHWRPILVEFLFHMSVEPRRTHIHSGTFYSQSGKYDVAVSLNHNAIKGSSFEVKVQSARRPPAPPPPRLAPLVDASNPVRQSPILYIHTYWYSYTHPHI